MELRETEPTLGVWSKAPVSRVSTQLDLKFPTIKHYSEPYFNHPGRSSLGGCGDVARSPTCNMESLPQPSGGGCMFAFENQQTQAYHAHASVSGIPRSPLS